MMVAMASHATRALIMPIAFADGMGVKLCVVLITQQPSARYIHAQAKDRHGNCLIERDLYGMQQPPNAFPANQHCNQREDDRGGECGEVP